MKRSCSLTFLDDEEWATFKEAMRKLRKTKGGHAPITTDAQLVAELCREYLDRPVESKAAQQ